MFVKWLLNASAISPGEVKTWVPVLTRDTLVDLLCRDWSSLINRQVLRGSLLFALRFSEKYLRLSFFTELNGWTAGPNLVGNCYIRLHTITNTDTQHCWPTNARSWCIRLHVAKMAGLIFKFTLQAVAMKLITNRVSNLVTVQSHLCNVLGEGGLLTLVLRW